MEKNFITPELLQELIDRSDKSNFAQSLTVQITQLAQILEGLALVRQEIESEQKRNEKTMANLLKKIGGLTDRCPHPTSCVEYRRPTAECDPYSKCNICGKVW